MPRVVAVMVPELSITTVCPAVPPVQVMSVVSDSVPPAWIVPVSLPLTVFADVTVEPLATVKEAMIPP